MLPTRRNITDASLGLTPTVTEDGYCSDGCFQFGAMALSASADYTALANIPFKAVLDDCNYVLGMSNSNSNAKQGSSSGRYYVQASYDLRPPAQMCNPNDSTQQCLLEIDVASGQLLGSKPMNVTVYKYARSTAPVVRAWMEGSDALCSDPYNNFLFGDFNTTSAQLTGDFACISHNSTIHMDEWVSSFSLDNSVLATASGNAEGEDAQLLVFDSRSGQTLLNSDLSSLPQALGASQNLIWVWSVDFM